MDATGTFGPGMEDFFNKYVAAVIPTLKWRQGYAEENKTLKGAAKAVAVFRRRGRIASAARSNRAYKIIRLIERVRQAALRDGAAGRRPCLTGAGLILLGCRIASRGSRRSSFG